VAQIYVARTRQRQRRGSDCVGDCAERVVCEAVSMMSAALLGTAVAARAAPAAAKAKAKAAAAGAPAWFTAGAVNRRWGSHSTPFSAALDFARATKPECKVDGTVLDVGARGGEQTYEALNASFARVIAVECQADEWYRLRALWRNTPEVQLLHMCASDAAELKTLFNAEGATTLDYSQIAGHPGEMQRFRKGGRTTDTVVALPLDGLLWTAKGVPSSHLVGPLCALKVDVQGFERQVLDGLNRSVAHYKPVVYLEYDHRLHTRGLQPRAWLEARGYVCVPDDSKRSSQLAIDEHTTAELGCLSGYCDLTS
jgi:FkbM family methyltransferase